MKNYTCPYPMTGKNCTVTTGESIADSLMIFSLWTGTVAGLCILFLSRQLYLLHKYKKMGNGPEIYYIITIVASFMSVLTAIDPSGYKNIFPVWLRYFSIAFFSCLPSYS
jgi:hypothetical protein